MACLDNRRRPSGSTLPGQSNFQKQVRQQYLEENVSIGPRHCRHVVTCKLPIPDTSTPSEGRIAISESDCCSLSRVGLGILKQVLVLERDLEDGSNRTRRTRSHAVVRVKRSASRSSNGWPLSARRVRSNSTASKHSGVQNRPSGVKKTCGRRWSKKI
eukprot:754423-Hanusia_phi.AAC.2